MNIYALYTYTFYPFGVVQSSFQVSPDDVKVNMDTEDKNIWLDRLFGDRNTDVRIQRTKKRGADKFPCKVLAHGNGRVVWLRLENEKIRRLWVKHRSSSPNDPDPIKQEDIAENPFSHIFLDCRKGKNLIAIMKETDAWRNTDVAAKLLEESLNLMMWNAGYGFCIKLQPVTVSKDYWNYNRQLILKDKRRVRKMTIYFGNGTLDSRVMEYISQSPLLKRLLKETFEARRGKLELDDPFGPRIVDGRKRDLKNLIALIGSNLTSDAFGLSLAYDDGQEVVCGKDVRLMFPMKTDTFDMLFSPDLFGEYPVNDWLDRAVEYIKEQIDGKTIESKSKRKAPRHIQDTSASLDLL